MSVLLPVRPLRRLLTGLIGLALVGGVLVASADTASAGTPSRYLVQTSTPSVAGPMAKARQSGGTVLSRFEHVLNGFTAELTPAEAVRLANSSSVQNVIKDVRYSVRSQIEATATQSSPTWGLDRIDQRTPAPDQRYGYLNDGTGSSVFVIDSGVRLTHAQLRGRAVSGWDFVGNDANASDCAGHGTHVAGTTAGSVDGVAKRTRIVSVRVLDCEGDGYVIDMINALEWVLAHKPAGPAAVNLSLGFAVNPSNAALATSVDNAVRKVVAAGVPVVVAAGNYGDEGMSACDYSPARAPAAITVGASDTSDTRAYFSNRGSCVDLYAPGVGVRSAWVNSDSATAYLSGTSMAAPHVAGAVARTQQDNPLASAASIGGELITRSTKNVIGDAAGAPNRLLYLAPPEQLAGKPTAVAISRSDSAKTVTVRWAPPASTGGSAITSYRVIRTGSADAGGKRTAVANLAASTRSHRFAGLVAGGSYAVRVLPLTAQGPGWAAGASAKLLAKPGTPGIKKASSGTKKSKGISVTARWATPSSGGAVASYQVKADRVGSSKDKTVTVPAAKREVKITGLAKNKKYQITVRAVNGAGNSSWSKKSGKVTAR